MKLSNLLHVIRIALLVGLVAIALPVGAFGQGRGSGLGRKCEKFVNCHDARDGRWDGRGPRSNVGVNDRFYRRGHHRSYYRHRAFVRYDNRRGRRH